MKPTIKKVLKTYLKENTDKKDKILRLIEKHGLVTACNSVGGYKSLKNIVGSYNEIKIDYFIDMFEDVLNEFEDTVHVDDVGMATIVTRDEDGELCQIEMLYPTGVGIACYGGYKYEQELDFLVMNYYELEKEVVYEIFEGLIDYLEYGNNY